MIRVFQIAALGCLALLITGCNGSKEDDAIWEQVKITDLAPSQAGVQPGELLKTANFSFYVFEIPAENIGALDDIRQMLYARPLKFIDYRAFVANSFTAGFGQMQMWDKIRNLLISAGGTTIERVSLLLPDGETNDIHIAALNNEQTIFYYPTEDSVEGVTIGPGKLTLRIRAEKIPGSRGICKTEAQPAFTPPAPSPIERFAPRGKSEPFLFSTVGFGLKMGPNDFFLVGPKEYIDNQMTLGGLFFSRPGRRPAVRVYMLVCTMVNF